MSAYSDVGPDLGVRDPLHYHSPENRKVSFINLQIVPQQYVEEEKIYSIKKSVVYKIDSKPREYRYIYKRTV